MEERTLELQAMIRELESFSYSVSHDLQSPLRAIHGFSEALREELDGILTDDARYYLERIRNATLRMGELIDGLLNLSRVTRCELNFHAIDLTRMAKYIAISLREGDPTRNVTFDIEEGLVAHGDQTLLQLLLQNLLSNAWKFTMRRSDARIAFGRIQEERNTYYYVRDNGAGFDMQFAGKLFRLFERLHAIGEFSGTGIGLATVRRIVERHSGHVWAEGVLENGATFYFSLSSLSH